MCYTNIYHGDFMTTVDFLAQNALLFSNMNTAEIEKMLVCLECKERTFEKNEPVLRRGEPFEKLGVVLGGTLLVTREDEHGNLFVLAQVTSGQIFGMSFISGTNSDIAICAGSDARVLLVEANNIFSTCSCACKCHTQFMRNLYTCMARKNVELTRKVYHISQRTLRRKIMSYLTEQMELSGSDSFEIPLDRQQLADYLACDRSALSAELARMKAAELIDYNKNRFTVFNHNN